MKTRIIIQNLKCGGCAKTILNRLEDEQDINNARVLIDENTVQIDHENAETPGHIKNILKQLGYPSVEEENGFMAKARSVVSCASGRLKD